MNLNRWIWISSNQIPCKKQWNQFKSKQNQKKSSLNSCKTKKTSFFSPKRIQVIKAFSWTWCILIVAVQLGLNRALQVVLYAIDLQHKYETDMNWLLGIASNGIELNSWHECECEFVSARCKWWRCCSVSRS